MKTLIIIPAYNEEKNILKTYKSIMKLKKYDCIVINDGSKDNTLNVLIENKIPHINLLENLGIGGAVQTGYKYAFENNYDIAVQFDGDGQHDASYIENIIKPIKEGESDFVIGSRFIDKSSSEFQSSSTRRVGIKLISSLIKFFTRKKIYDPTSGFRAANKNIIKKFAKYYPAEYPEPESSVYLLKNKFKILEVPVSMNERSGGKSSIHSWKSVYYMINVSISIFIESIKRGDL
ncbi:MAG: glycosyltransferase family 2 protein [Mycoplasmatota bacterium]